MSLNPPAVTPDAGAETCVFQFPASVQQTQFWILDQIDPGTTSSNIAIRWKVRGTVSSDILEQAFNHVIDRHEILRTRFVEVDGTPQQEVMAKSEFKLATVDIRNMAENLHAAKLEDIAQQESQSPFDLTRSGLLRATLVRFSAARAMLLITAHHSIFDGYSIGILGREIGLTLAAMKSGMLPELPNLPLQYGDFSLWQQDWLASGVLAEARAYWAQRLVDLPYFELPTDHPRPKIFDHSVARVTMDLPQGFHQNLAQSARRHSVSPFAFGAAVASITLHRLTGATDISFGAPIAMRDQPELEAVIGPMINSQILRFSLAGNMKFGAHLMAAKQHVSDAIAHQNMPFSGLVEMLSPKRDRSRAPLVSVNFNLQNTFMQNRDFDGVTLISSPSSSPAVERDLNIQIIGRPSGWRITLEYAGALFDASSMEKIMAALADAFQHAFDNADPSVDSFPCQAFRHDEPPLPLPADAPVKPPMTQPLKIKALVSGHWENVLGRTNLPDDVSFFDLGGHSLLAVRAIARLRAACDIELGVAAIYEHPTISELAAHIATKMQVPEPQTAAAVEDVDWQIEPIITGGPGQPIIAINEIGIILSTQQHMAVKHPSTCVRLFDGTRGIDQTRRSFEDIATEYAKVIKRAQPKGPYLLFGVCVHGNIAVETARVLQAQGEEIAGVILKDVWEPAYSARLLANRVTRILERKHALFNRLKLMCQGRMSPWAVLGSYGLIRKSGLLQLAVRLGLTDRIRRIDLSEEQEKFVNYITDARNLYRPAPLNVPVLHIVTGITAQGPLFSPSIGWEHVITGPLKTVHLKEVFVNGTRQMGTDELAVEIENFLGATDQTASART